MKARQPDHTGYAVNDGVRIYYEVHGSGDTTVLLLPTWSIVDKGVWKMQIPYLARHFRVITYDPRGNGRSDRPQDPQAYTQVAMTGDALAVMDDADTDTAVVVAYCASTARGMMLTRDHPERVHGLVTIAPNVPAVGGNEDRGVYSFEDELDTDEGWARENRHYWKRDWAGYLDWFMSNVASEPHSTKLYDDLVGWGMQTDAATILCTLDAPEEGEDPHDVEVAEAGFRALTRPTLTMVGDQDQIVSPEIAIRVAELTGGDLFLLKDGGHAIQARHPVPVNHAIRAFVDRIRPPARTVTPFAFARTRRRHALWVSSPIGLGHVLRDIAIARELRERVPDLHIDWLAQSPVTQMLEAVGETIHPASIELASESAHWESEASAHDLHAFYALRRMDEILLANYMLFDDITRETPYDLWVGDESWEVDHYLHENPERKTAPYVFTTDFVGFLPVNAEADPREAELCADYNAEMIEHRARFPRLRDQSIFIGGFDELPDASMGAGLPTVRGWTEDWFESVPYVLPSNALDYRDVAAVRARLGHGVGYPLIVAAVGGTAVGAGLLELIAEGFRYLRKDVPEARMLMVTGPRIDPRDLPDIDGMTKLGFVPNLYEHLAACDAAVVQGGLSTTMELVAAGRPFLYFPLQNHFEQRRFVAHRLDAYGAGIRMEYAQSSPLDVAVALQRALTQPVNYRPVPSDGAAKAADRIASLLTR
ncbi:MAG TPA: alpha/beta fold hydrolase [Nocardioidaceae bacterium]|nr:alpha/beta fold hydrolase [Nocardioidaceae bacterium]